MNPTMVGKQRTIKNPCRLSGVGLHSGKEAAVLFSPAPEDSGIFFLKEGKKIPARLEQFKETRRGTSLKGIATTEHLLSAVYALQIDNLAIEVNGEELPALDGSALPYVEALEKAGIFEQKALKNPIQIMQPIKVVGEEASIEALPFSGLRVHFMVNFPGAGEQKLDFDLDQNSFKQEIAPARTFGYLEEYEVLKKQGLALGASLENALVLGKDGYVNAPRFSDEIVRHKVLDLIGDLALLGRPLQAEVRAVKSGHKLNIELVRRILENDRAGY